MDKFNDFFSNRIFTLFEGLHKGIMFLEIPNNIKIIRIFLLFSFTVCWLSISTSFEDLLIFSENNNLNYKNLINFFRHLSVYICFFFLILIFLFFNKKIDFKKYIVFYFLIGYFASQTYGLFFSYNSIENISFIISALTTILTIILLDSFFSRNEKKYFIIISFAILNIVFFLTFLPLFLNYLDGGSIYGGLLPTDPFLNKTSPRSSGLARTALIILMFIELFEIYYFKKHLKKIYFLKLSFITFICLFQSRTIIFLTILTYLIIFINKNKLTFKNFFKFIFLYILTPTFLFILLSSFNSYKYVKSDYNLENKEKTFVEHLNSEELKILRVMPEKNFSSGRYEDWYEIMNKMSGKNFIYGFGAQGDRHLINQSASNGFLYAYSSSGIIGVIFFMIFLIIVGFKTIKIFIYQFRENMNEIIHCLIITLLSLRAILETSYAVFSIDLIIFILAVSFIFDNNVKVSDIKIKLFK